MLGSTAMASAQNDVDARYAAYPSYDGADLELSVDPTGTRFALWSPEAESVRVFLYDTDRNSQPTDTLNMVKTNDGVWRAEVNRQLYGKFYTFSIRYGGQWLAETPGVWAKAVGTNGERAAIIDFSTTNPTGEATGIDHLKELGITHVHILPSYDYNSVDEANMQLNQYNWGYDPLNYNAPEGSYSTDPADPAVRVRQMKEMVKALHDAGIGVVMDVVYNHTAQKDDSNFSLTAPGYYYRHRADGSYSDASGCGNETASDRQQMRNFIINSVKYWATEYHIDGFRFDLMAIHDTETMSQVAAALKEINPSIFVYGEGWTAGDSPLPVERRALKENVSQMTGIAVFSDDLRDAVKGHYSNAAGRGFATGAEGNEETVRIGIVAATAHPQVDYSLGNNSRFPYAASPEMIVNYVSCHDDMCLTDKLAASMPGSTEAQRQRAARLAQTIVFTSQGTPFMFAGEELFRDKKGVHNTYKSPDSVNGIDWNLKHINAEQFNYYVELIRLRRTHPAFRMTTAEDIARNIVFDKVSQPNLISYSIKNNANGDEWREIKLVFNGSDEACQVKIAKGEWIVIARDGKICATGLDTCKGGMMTVEPVSALILARVK